MADSLLGNAYAVALAARKKRESLGVPDRDFRSQEARAQADHQRAQVRVSHIQDEAEKKYGVSRHELKESGPLNTLMANGELFFDSALARAKHKVAQYAATAEDRAATAYDDIPVRYRQAYEEYQNITLGNVPKADNEIRNPFNEADNLEGLSPPQRMRAQQLKAMLDEPAFVEHKLPFQKEAERAYYNDKNSFMHHLGRAEKFRQGALEKVGDEAKGIPDMFDSQAKVNPYHREQLQQTIQREQHGLETRKHAAQLERDAVALWNKKDATVKDAVLNTAQAGANLLASAATYGFDNARHANTVTNAYIGNPGAMVQEVATSVPDMLGGAVGIGASAGLQAMEDRILSDAALSKRTGTNIRTESEKRAQDAFTALNFGANYAENMLLGKLAKGGSMRGVRAGIEDLTPKTAVGKKVRNLLATTANPATNLLKDVGTAYGINAGAGYIQSKVQQGWGALDFEKDTGRAAVESAVSGGLMATGFAGPTALSSAVMDIGHNAKDVKERKSSNQRASFDENINPESEKYSPTEAINKQVEAFNKDGADREAVRENAKTALRSAQADHDKYTKRRESINEQIEYADTLEAEIKDNLQAMKEDPSKATELQESNAEYQAVIDSIREKYSPEAIKAFDSQHRKVTQTLEKAQESYHSFFGMAEHVEGKKTSPTVARDNVEIVKSPDATPEQKAQAVEHVKSYPMMYKPEEIKAFSENLGNLLTDPQRTLLREFSELRQGDHLTKGLQGVKDDIVNGSRNYRSLDKYFVLHSEAKRVGDEGGMEKISTQFDNFATNYAAKAALAKEMFPMVQNKPGVEVQAIKTESGKWRVNSGKRLTREALKANGGFEFHMGSEQLYRAILSDNDRVQKAHDVFNGLKGINTPQAVEATPKAEPVVEAETALPEPTPTPEQPVAVHQDNGDEPPMSMYENDASWDMAQDQADHFDMPHGFDESENPAPTPEHKVEAKAPETKVAPKKVQKKATEPKVKEKSKQGTLDLDTPEPAPKKEKAKAEPKVEKEPTKDEPQQEQLDLLEEPHTEEPIAEDEPDATIPTLQGVTEADAKAEHRKDFNLRDLVKGYFTQGPKAKKDEDAKDTVEAKAKPLASIHNMVSRVIKSDNARERITKLIGKEPTLKQSEHLEEFLRFHDDFVKTLDKVFMPKDAKYANKRYEDMVHFLVGEDGQLTENVKTAIALGAFNWILENGSINKYTLTDKEILKLLSIPTDLGFTVPNPVRSILGTAGVRQNQAITSVGARIVQSLHLKATDKADPELQGRLESSLGALAVSTLKEQGMAREVRITGEQFNSFVEQVGYEMAAADNAHASHSFLSVGHYSDRTNTGKMIGENELITQMIESGRKTSGFLSDLFGAVDPMRRPDLKPPVMDQQSIKNSKMSIPDKARKNAQKAMKEPYQVREHVVNLFRVLHDNSEDMLKRMLDIDDSKQALDKVHVSVRENVKAKNMNEWQVLKNGLDYMSELEEHRKDGELPNIFFRIIVWSNQRMGYAPNMFNMQTSQIHRAMVGMRAHITKVDLPQYITDDMGNSVRINGSIKNGKTTKYGTLLRAIAAGAEEIKLNLPPEHKGSGKTVDKVAPEHFLPAFEEYLRKDYVVANIRAMGRVLKATDAGKLPDPKDVDMVASQVKEFGMGAPSLLALTELARMFAHDSKKGPYTTTMGIESDGVTNGPAIANMLSGVLTNALALQFGLIPKVAAARIKNYFDIKTAGEPDYYESFGREQRTYLDRIMNIKYDDEGNTIRTVRSVATEALDALAGGFGGRGSAKKWATPFNYSAGFPALKAALARELVASVNNEFAKIAAVAKSGDEATAQTMLDKMDARLNAVFKFHNEHLQVRKPIESKPTEILSHLDSIEADLRMRFPDAELPPRPESLKDEVGMAYYANALSVFKEPREKLTPKDFQYAMNVVIKRNNQALALTTKQVGLIYPRKVNLAGMADQSLKAEQYQALALASTAIHGLASEHAIKQSAGAYIRTRDLNIQMNNLSFNAFSILREALVKSRLEKKRGVKNAIGTIEGKDKPLEMEGLSREEQDKIDRELSIFAPVLVSALGSESENHTESGFHMSKSERGYDTAERNQVLSRTNNLETGKQRRTVTGIIKRVDREPGVLGSALYVQGGDSRISSNTVAQTPSINVHDANIGGMDNYQEMALLQNKEFFNMMVGYRSQVENLNALIRPLNGLATAVTKYGLEDHVSTEQMATIHKALLSMLGQAGLLSNVDVETAHFPELLATLSDAKYQSEIDKIEYAQTLYAVHQYGGEGGELVLGDAEHSALEHELEELKKDRDEARNSMDALGSKLFERANKDDIVSDTQTTEATGFQKDLAAYKGKEVPKDVMLKALAKEIKNSDDLISGELFKLLKGILPEGLKFEYVTESWVGSKGASGWFNPKTNTISIRAVGAKFNNVKPELLLHEMVHASLVSVTTDPHAPQKVKETVQRIEELRQRVEAEIGHVFPEALVNKEEFMAWGLTNTRFQDALKGILVSKGERNRKGWRSAFSAFVSNVMKILTQGTKWSPNAKEISAIEALLIDSAELIQMISNEEVDRSYTPDRTFNMVQQVKEESPREFFDRLSQGNTSSEFNTHLGQVTEDAINRVYDTLGKDHLKNLDKPVNYVAKAFASIHGLSEREEYVAEVTAAIAESAQGASANTPVMKELNNVFNAARRQVSAENFHDGDWSTASASERALAQSRYDSIFVPKLVDGRSSHLSNFVGLAMGSERFHNMLKGIEVKRETKADRTFVQKVVDTVYRMFDWATGALARTRYDMDAQQKTDTLLNRLIDIDLKKRQETVSKVDRAWDFAMDKMSLATSKGTSAIAKALVKLDLQNSRRSPLRSIGKLAKVASSESLEKLPGMMQEMRDTYHPNQRFGEFNEVANEVRNSGDHKQIAEAMVRETTNIQTMRKNWIDNTKRMANEGFINDGKDLTKEQHTGITYAILRTDMQSLLRGRDFKTVMKLLENRSARRYERQALEREIMRLDPNGLDMVHRAQELGHHMIHSEGGDGLAVNARLIADGMDTHYQRADNDHADEALVKALDDLASIHALEYLGKDHREKALEVIKLENEREDGGHGVEGLLKLHTFAVDDTVKNFTDNPYSILKGYLPEVTHTYRETMHAPTKQAAQYEKEGWVHVNKLERDPNDKSSVEMSLYMMKDSGKQSIVSGAVTFDSTHSRGTEVNDLSLSEYQQYAQSAATVRARIPLGQYEPNNRVGKRMVPIRDANGKITGGRYVMSSETRDSLLQRNNNFADLLGSYIGNNVGREPILEQNKKVINAMYDVYVEDYAKNPRAYVAISSKSTDPRLAEIWRMLPYEVRKEAESLWGKGNPMMIRNDLVNVSFGFKKYSLSEMWDKKAHERNWAEHLFMGLLESAVGVKFLPKERARLATIRGERFIQEAMKKVKDFIVIRSMSVLWGNIKANTLLLTAYGVNPINVAKDTLLSFRAGLSYRKQRALIIQAEAHLRSGIGDVKKWEHQLATAQDAISRNPLIDFLESGMMPSIVEDVSLNQADYTYQTAFNEKVDGYIKHVPKSIRTIGKWAMLSPDTPAYKFLAESTQYSDFTSKYVLYKHLTSKKGVKHEQALQDASDAFINYDVPTSRGMQYMNDMGLFMFTKFFLRFQKVLFKLMNTQPANVLAQHYATEWLTNTPGVLDPAALNQIGWPLHSSILQAPSALTNIVTFKTLF